MFLFSDLDCISVLDSLVDPLQKTINFKPKQDAVKQEVDRNEDMIRSALRAIVSLNRIRFVFSAAFEPSYVAQTILLGDNHERKVIITSAVALLLKLILWELKAIDLEVRSSNI